MGFQDLCVQEERGKTQYLHEVWELRVYSLGTDTSVGIVLEQGLGVDENKNRFDSGQTHATFCIDEGRKKNKVKLLQPDYR